MQERPICLECEQPIKSNSEMVFEAPCGHGECPSAVFHSLCLFEWRERRAKVVDWLQEARDRWLQEHGEKLEQS